MKLFVIVPILVLLFALKSTEGIENLIGTSMQKCLNCLCHARSGCWSRFNCARYSISQDYWIHAGSQTIGSYPNPSAAYTACMGNENCILNTVKSYTESFGEKDCNCDGVFDCKDRLAIHLFGADCFNPNYGSTYSRRFNDCSKQIGVTSMASIEGDCTPEVF